MRSVRTVVTCVLVILIGTLLLYPGKPVQVQAKTTHQVHDHSLPGNMIDGRVHPELIPDSVAYRLYLITVSVPSNATENDKRVQSSHLAKVKLNSNDLQSVTAVLAGFRSQYDAWLSKYNEEAAAQGAAFDPTSFLQQQEDLVQSTRATLAKSLSASGMALLSKHIQGEKRFMKVAVN